MQENSSQDFENYMTSVKTESEDVIKNKFPQKIEELSKLLDSEQFSFEHQLKNLYEEVNIPVPVDEAKPSSSSAPNLQSGGDGGETNGKIKKRKLVSVFADPNSSDSDSDEEMVTVTIPSTPITCNSTLSKNIEAAKPFIRELLEHSNLLKRWLTLQIPKVEDGNNFGVDVIEATLNKVMLVEFEADSFYDEISKYNINRGKAISKVAKYPHINDYRRHVAELDEKEFLSLRITLSKIRNNYAIMYDLIEKNWEKIITPRATNITNLY